MTDLDIEYKTHPKVTELIEWIQYCAEFVSLDFTEWDHPYVSGPGLYFAVVADCAYGAYADPMGANQWPADQCSSVFDSAFPETCRTVGIEQDGGVVVAVDGMIEEQMVRFRDLGQQTADDVGEIQYQDWMGSRHMSAVETSVRPEVVTTITLSGETGRVSVFQDGAVDTVARSELGGSWRVE